MSVRLTSPDVELNVDPDRGGGVLSFRFGGRDVFRAAAGPGSPLDLANFPLLPFANRISGTGARLAIASNAPDIDGANAIHGFGWLAPWSLTAVDDEMIVIAHESAGKGWPWAYRAKQTFTLLPDGYAHHIEIENLSAQAMPSGLGVHPYFPRASARLDLPVSDVWSTDACGLPTVRQSASGSRDWFDGTPHDHCFRRAADAIVIDWPIHRLRVTPGADLPFVQVYIPADEDYFCIEPVSHIPDAVNRVEPDAITGLRWLRPGEMWRTQVLFQLERKS